MPGRLKNEMVELIQTLKNGQNIEITNKHYPWFKELLLKIKKLEVKKEELDQFIEQEIGIRFVDMLECGGVFKLNDKGKQGMDRFMSTII